MILLDISKSDYIFRQGYFIFVFGLLFCTALIIYAIYCFRKAQKSNEDKIKKDEYFKSVMLGLFSIAIWFWGFMPACKDLYKLRQNGIETEGKALQWVIVKGKHVNKYIRYSFDVNGKTFIDKCGIVYGGSEIKGITCPGGHYIVIYDKDDPTNSVMDFKRRITE